MLAYFSANFYLWEQNYSRRQRASSHVNQIQAFNLTKMNIFIIITNSLVSAIKWKWLPSALLYKRAEQKLRKTAIFAITFWITLLVTWPVGLLSKITMSCGRVPLRRWVFFIRLDWVALLVTGLPVLVSFLKKMQL